MNALREIYDFITGGSIVAPIGLAVAILGVLFFKFDAVVFAAVIFTALAMATREKIA